MRKVLGGEAELQPKATRISSLLTVVKCRGQPLGVGWCRRVHEATHLSGSVFHSLTRTTANALRFLRRLRGRCLYWW